MELKAYIKLLQKNFWFIVICVAVASAIAYYAAQKSQTGYKLEQTYFLSQTPVQTLVPDQQQVQPPNFGNYYQQETARNFTDTVVAVLENPNFYNQFTPARSDISVQKLAPQFIKISIISPTASEAKFLLERLVIGFNQNLKTWDPSGNLELKMVGQSQEPTINSLDTKVIVAAGAILGFALAVCVVALKTYFKL